MTLRTSAWIAAGISFVAATVWINYEVKVNIQQAGANGNTAQLGSIRVGKPAPEISAPDLSGRTVKLSDYRGRKVVLLDFWATWCGPCKMAMPGLQTILDDLKARGLEILSVNEGESAGQAGTYIAKKGYGFHVVLDATSSIGSRYGVRGIPTLMVIDKAGIVRQIRVGFTPDDSDLRQVVEKYLNK